MADESTTKESPAEIKAPEDRHASLSAAYETMVKNPATHLVRDGGQEPNADVETKTENKTVEEPPQKTPTLEGKEGLVQDDKLRGKISLDEDKEKDKEKNVESSRLGRNVKELRQQNDALSQKVDNLTTLIQTFVSQKQSFENNDTEQQSFKAPEAIITDEDVLQTVKARAEEFRKTLFKGTPLEKMQTEELYRNSYRDQMLMQMDAISDDEEIYKDMETLITENNGKFNQILNLKTPVKDAIANFNAAYKKVLASKTAQPREPQTKLRQETAKGTGVPETRSQESALTEEKPITDPTIKEYLQRTGKSEEWARKVISKKPQGYDGFMSVKR